jgi:carotenoid cleavage dioxygenase-like enzyme
VGKDGQINSSIRIPLRGSRFMHDMGLTQKYAVIIDLPAAFDFQSEGTPWTFDRNLPLRFGVIPRYASNPNQVVWFDCKPGMIFHTINAFDSGDQEITMQCCRSDAYTMGFNRSADPDNWLFPYEWILNLQTGKVSERKLCPIRCDFPTVHPKMVSKRQQFSYYATYRSRPGDHVPLYDGLVKLDHNTLAAVHIQLQPHLSCAEFTFVPRKDARTEDDGYLLTFVYNDQTHMSEFVIYDAKTLVSGDGNKCCVCRVSLPQHVPYGFHGNWLSRREVDTAINC